MKKRISEMFCFTINTHARARAYAVYFSLNVKNKREKQKKHDTLVCLSDDVFFFKYSCKNPTRGEITLTINNTARSRLKKNPKKEQTGQQRRQKRKTLPALKKERKIE